MSNQGALNYQPIATISRPVGLYGEVRLKPSSRYFEKYIRCSDLFISKENFNPTPIQILRIRGSDRKKTFKIEGVNSRDEAKIINGSTIFAIVPINDKINQISKDLINWKVISISKGYIGKLVDIMWCPANDVYVVKNQNKEYLIPLKFSFF